MGFRFNRRLTIVPGIHLNIGTGGASLSVGPQGASVNIGRRGVYGNVGIPGTGMSYRTRLDRARGGQADTLPDGLSMEIRGDRIAFVDAHGRELPESLRPHAVREHRAEAERLLESAENETVLRLTAMHLDAPAPGRAAPRLAPLREKPTRGSFPDQDAFMAALMGWRAEKANREAGGGGTYDPHDLERALEALEWPRETNISYDFSPDGSVVVLDVDLPEIEDMPGTETTVGRRDLVLRTAPRSASKIADLYSAHVASAVFRLVAVVFARSPAGEVRVSGYTQRTGTTGRLQDEYVVAVTVDRDRWAQIDFMALDRIDPENALRRFGLSMERTGRGALRTVPPCPGL
jgi:hypothetical protein